MLSGAKNETTLYIRGKHKQAQVTDCSCSNCIRFSAILLSLGQSGKPSDRITLSEVDAHLSEFSELVKLCNEEENIKAFKTAASTDEKRG